MYLGIGTRGDVAGDKPVRQRGRETRRSEEARFS
jgi:hypothetical protein